MSDIPDELLERLDRAHRYEDYIVSLCPFHDDTRPSFFVYADKYHCLSCGKFGNTADLLDRLDTSHVYHTNEIPYNNYNPWSKWLRNHEILKILKIAFRNQPVKYLINRKISREVQKQLKIGILDGWITFPIFSPYGKVIGAVARAGEGNNSQSKYMIPRKQDPNMIYMTNWSRCIKQDTLYLTFGILDAITLYSCGLAAASTTTGKRLAPAALDFIKKRIIIIPDRGEEKEALKLARKLGWRGKVLRLHYPNPAKDINDLVWKCGLSLKEVGEML